jgi:transcriptional regulator with XRE-family HTH domain/anti-sigma regulatory factor (Ser/Thr protein kinase)
MVADVVPLGSRLRQRREELGLSQSQAAQQLEVARTAYRLWELEAARPAPDRWRAIARWLGISMTALLHAEELLDEQEALEATRAAVESGLSNGGWDAQSDAWAGDYFSQERAMIAAQAERGAISVEQAAGLERVLERIQDATSDDVAPWHPGHFAKRFTCDEHAPGLARAALATTAIGMPSDTFDDAALVTSELVTNSVEHASCDSVQVEIVLGVERLRIAVSDQGKQAIRPRPGDGNRGWGLTFIGELASRWGVERRRDGNTIWAEFDLTPG